MTKIFILLFGLLTAGAIMMTVFDVGVMEPTITRHSIRDGSLHTGAHRLGGYRGGK